MNQLTAKLTGHAFCQGLSSEQINTIASLSAWREFDAKEEIFRAGDAADEFFMIFSGHATIMVDLTDRQTTAIETIGEGDILGWSWFSPPHQWRFSATTVERTGVIAINGKKLREICEEDQALGYQILKKLIYVYTRRLEMARSQILELSRSDPFMR